MVCEKIWMFLVARPVQGLGMGGSSSIPRAIMGDVFYGKRLFKISSYISIAASLGPAVAPILGGYIQYFSNWQMNFVLLLVLAGVVLSFVLFFFHESFRSS